MQTQPGTSRARSPSLNLRLSSGALARLALVVALGVAVWLAMLPMNSTPPVLPVDAPAAQFSGARAYRHLRVVAAEPHPMGSAEHQKVIDYIVSQLRSLGLETDLHESIAVKPEWEGAHGQVRAAQIKNIVARIPGNSSSGALLLASHYHSMPTSPNAADGGIGVATLLETARALLANPPLANDVILFFGDGDATPTLGEKAFQSHRWFKDIRLGLELEATPKGASAIAFAGQGSPDRSGPISPYLESDNGWYLREALKVAPYPFAMMALNDYPLHASSLYSIMVDTNIKGLGFVQFLQGEAYHTLLDNPGNVEPGSLQHHGGYMLALSQHFGNLKLDQPMSAPAQIAFSIWPGVVVHYPATWAIPLAALLGLLFLLVVALGLWRKRLKVGGVLMGLGLFVLSLVASLAVTALVWKLASALNPAYQAFFTRGYYGTEWRMASFVALTVAVVSLLYLGARRILKAASHDNSVAAGALLVPTLLAVFVSLTLPSPSYLFFWPALAGVLLLAWSMFFPGQLQHPWLRASALALTAFVPLVLLVPPFFALFPALAGLGAGMAVSPIVGAFVLIAIFLGTLVPHLQFLGGERRWIVPFAFGALALLFLITEVTTSKFDTYHPQPNQIQYTLNADTATATWQSAASKPDAWTQQFFPNGYTAGKDAFSPGYFFEQEFGVIRTAAPVLPLPAPQLKVLEDTTAEGVRTLRLRLISPRGAYAAHLDMNLPGNLVKATVGGKAVEIEQSPTKHIYDIPAQERGRFPLLVHGLSSDGLDMVLVIQGTGPIEVRLADYSNGLPEVLTSTLSPRPPEFMPAPYDFRDPSVVHTSFSLPPR